jgi:hypothetical protein
LRKAGELATESPRRVSLIDLDSPYMTVTVRPTESSLATITVTRGGKPQDYSVPSEGGQAAAGQQGKKP